MVHDRRVRVLFHDREAITRRQGLGFAVLNIRERVVAGVGATEKTAALLIGP